MRQLCILPMQVEKVAIALATIRKLGVADLDLK